MNKGIGFTTVGQDAVVKLEAFPFTRYGTIAAHVTKIAADAILEPAASHEGDPATRQAKTTFSGAETMWTLPFPTSPSLRLIKFQQMTVTSI
ncbi:hypothetical protein [Rhizobium laguerreae]|uniref:hypothetical protein n=1 Tax=Rhizobium laguerreae TaxID=1076926 RepID=UPI0021B0BB9B|nr:hypothetical protein [Rhizobium laguerreae]